jgi:ergothioneine biosynthesis protein EgtB
MNEAHLFNSSLERSSLGALYAGVRAASETLAAPLSDADASVQSMPDASPAKWHLAHTTWFFETMVLEAHRPGYRPFDARFNFLFNSYYETIGERHPRARRGMLTRPDLNTIRRYRAYVDAAMDDLLRTRMSAAVAELIELGCHHEQQHQELLLTDVLHLLAQNPLQPVYKPPEPLPVNGAAVMREEFLPFDGGLVDVGHDGQGFAFDSEGPRHRVWLAPYRLANRLVTNGEWQQFMASGGYKNPLYWLSEGWAKVCTERWVAPLYWEQRDGTYWAMTLRGAQPVDANAPVTHVSYYEADAYAAWAGKRLPSEMEWEHAVMTAPTEGNFADSGRLRPRRARGASAVLSQMYGDVWEWTRSAFSPYPGFKAVAGAVGEYNGKFMSGQFVLRGGSCATPAGHMRPTYRNFFPPDARWQFAGLRLAEDQ